MIEKEVWLSPLNIKSKDSQQIGVAVVFRQKFELRSPSTMRIEKLQIGTLRYIDVIAGRVV